MIHTGKVYKIHAHVAKSKTIKVVFEKKLFDSKYKRYYKKRYYRLVHYDPQQEPLLKELDTVQIVDVKRISARKSAKILWA